MMVWTFGAAPLPQTEALAAAMRRIVGLAVALEAEHPAVDELLDALARAEERLARAGPGDARPRVGVGHPGDGRIYVDHSRDIGGYNPCFPEYVIEVEGDRAHGTVAFPLAYEGPPGVVHGGFVAVFFDAVIQHHNCDTEVAGKTASLEVRFRRPTPLHTTLRFDIERTVTTEGITSSARLALGDSVLARATMGAVAGSRDALPAVDPRRPAR